MKPAYAETFVPEQNFLMPDLRKIEKSYDLS